MVLNYLPPMNIEHKRALANSYADLQSGIYTDTKEQRYVLVARDNVTGDNVTGDNVQFIPMERTTEEQLRKTYILELKGELTNFLAPDAAPYVPPTPVERRQQLNRDLLNLELLFGKSNVYHIADDHPGGSSARGRLLGLDD
jgi:hypothetical protein